MRTLCAVLFITFTFSYLFFYQADVMMATQHLLSGGQTHYERTIGAVLITVALYVLHLGVLAVTKLTHRAHSLTFFPSLLALAMLTGIQVNNDGTFSFGYWKWVAACLLLVFAVVAFLFNKMSTFEKHVKARYKPLRLLWSNVLVMCLMFLFVGLTANHDDVFHYRMRAENCLLHADYDGALKVGSKSLACDSNLTMLRIHALAKKRQLGEHLFEYPLCGGSAVMIPDGKSLRPVFYPSYKFIKYPRPDFQLCQRLLDKDLDGFARIMKTNEVHFGLTEAAPADSTTQVVALPKHYREALVLYTRMRSTPLLTYHHDVADADYEDFQKIYRGEKDAHVRYSKLRDLYSNTYWFYYFYGNKIVKAK